MASADRKTTVIFADLIGASSLRDDTGDTFAEQAIAGCRDTLTKAAVAVGGRVIKGTGDKMMVLIASPDAAADCAVAMHTAMDKMPEVRGKKVALGIGFHHGPVISRKEEVFGDTVNLASRLVEQAANGQILLTEETAKQLSALYRPWMRRLGEVEIKGRTDPVELCELVWRADDSATLYAKKRAQERPVQAVLTLRYRDTKIVRRREKDAITLGRDELSGLVIHEDQASRHHCTIERRQDKFVLVDVSTNGTYVTVDGEQEVLLQREEFTLRKHGYIAFGQPKVAAKDVVEFTCE